MKMAHTCVRVKDLEASLDFYQKAFNFEESRRRDFPENKFTLVYLTLPGDDYELELTYNYDHEAYDLGNGYGHIAISTDDLEGLHEKHQAAGFTVTDLKAYLELHHLITLLSTQMVIKSKSFVNVKSFTCSLTELLCLRAVETKLVSTSSQTLFQKVLQ